LIVHQQIRIRIRIRRILIYKIRIRRKLATSHPYVKVVRSCI